MEIKGKNVKEISLLILSREVEFLFLFRNLPFVSKELFHNRNKFSSSYL